MKKLLMSLLVLGTVFACVNNDSQIFSPTTTAEDPDWIKLEIPTGREAYAIAGDLDKTLLVTTWSKAYYTTDQGKTWQLSRDFQGPVPGLLVRNDTTFAMQSRSSDFQGNLLGASGVQYFSADYGKTWQYYFKYYKSYIDDILPIGTVKSGTGIGYSIKSNSTPTSPGSPTAYVNPSELRKQGVSGFETVRFPFKQNLMNLYLDDQNRLYVAASGGTYQPETNSFYCCETTMSAVIYVSRRPLP